MTSEKNGKGIVSFQKNYKFVIYMSDYVYKIPDYVENQAHWKQ